MARNFDCFISHNSNNKPAVIALAKTLRERGLSVWLDIDELRPGLDWLTELDRGLQSCASALAVVGADGQGPWQRKELSALLLRAVQGELPVIPVMLPGSPRKPDLPIFLHTHAWVDMSAGLDETALDRIVWGITGNKPVQAGNGAGATDAEGYGPRPSTGDRGEESIRWLHLSDLHLGCRGEALWAQVQAELEPSIREHAGELGMPDLILFTGDLTNRGAEAEFRQVDTFLETLRGWLTDATGSDRQPLIVPVPGKVV